MGMAHMGVSVNDLGGGYFFVPEMALPDYLGGKMAFCKVMPVCWASKISTPLTRK